MDKYNYKEKLIIIKQIVYNNSYKKENGYNVIHV